MAEITESHDVRPKGHRRQTKRLVKPDLTAMVDMAFLLLTFFVMTSNMHKDNTMLAVVFPEPGENHTPVSKEKILIMSFCLHRAQARVSRALDFAAKQSRHRGSHACLLHGTGNDEVKK